MSGRCDLHKGLRIEVTKEPFSMRRVANVVIALQRLKHTQNIKSTEFTDQELFNIIMENVIEESIVIDLKCSESKSYSRQDKVVQCTICDKSKRALVRREKPPILLAITLKGGNEENKAWFNLSAYTPPNCTENTRGQPVCLGIVKSNLFLSCTMANGTPFLGIEEVKDKESLKAIKENDGMELSFSSETVLVTPLTPLSQSNTQAGSSPPQRMTLSQCKCVSSNPVPSSCSRFMMRP
ncbi:hypothetical protein PHYPO_G00078740 [Pangasianodon hypophthalmus]|uniref:Interleukin-1 beta n=1 Tax=Pangasianodon hypophthalmus TaxID=310915 RepID=A0A5N5LKX8_PANHP|nr:hypothetical protein PHYPO_G00078740 [Pangasianodon hypophthalmus]